MLRFITYRFEFTFIWKTEELKVSALNDRLLSKFE